MRPPAFSAAQIRSFSFCSTVAFASLAVRFLAESPTPFGFAWTAKHSALIYYETRDLGGGRIWFAGQTSLVVRQSVRIPGGAYKDGAPGTIHAQQERRFTRQRLLVRVDTVDGDFDFSYAAEGEQKLYEVFGRLFRSLFHDVGNSVGDRGLEHHALGLQASQVHTHELTRLEHNS